MGNIIFYKQFEIETSEKYNLSTIMFSLYDKYCKSNHIDHIDDIGTFVDCVLIEETSSELGIYRVKSKCCKCTFE